MEAKKDDHVTAALSEHLLAGGDVELAALAHRPVAGRDPWEERAQRLPFAVDGLEEGRRVVPLVPPDEEPLRPRDRIGQGMGRPPGRRE